MLYGIRHRNKVYSTKDLTILGDCVTIEEMKARIELSYIRLEQLKSMKDRASLYEKEMHEHDIRLLIQMMKEWRP